MEYVRVVLHKTKKTLNTRIYIEGNREDVTKSLSSVISHDNL